MQNAVEITHDDSLPSIHKNQPSNPPKLALNVSGRKARFLRTYAMGWSIKQTAVITGIFRTNHDSWMKADPDYNADFKFVAGVRLKDLEESAYIRALRGNDRMTEFLLKAARPDYYGDKTHITTSSDINITIDDARAQLLSMISTNPQLRQLISDKLHPVTIDAKVIEDTCSPGES